MHVQIEESWRLRLQEEFDKPYFERLVRFVKEKYARYSVFPPGSRIFMLIIPVRLRRWKWWFWGRSLPGARTVLWVVFFRWWTKCLSCLHWWIYSGRYRMTRGNRYWSRGRLGGTRCLVVECCSDGAGVLGRIASGEGVTDVVIRYLNDEREHIVFMLWGGYAEERSFFRPATALCTDGSPSCAFIGWPEIFRLPAFQ